MAKSRINYVEFAEKFAPAKLEASFITVELWDNSTMEYTYVGEIVFERNGYTGFVYDHNYHGPPIDPAGLDFRKHDSVFVSSRNLGGISKFFYNLLPGSFGNRVLQSASKSWGMLTEVQRLAALCKSHAQFDALRLNAHLGQHDKQVIGIIELDKIVKKIVAYSTQELSDILDDENFKALTILGGARGKTDYFHDDGQRYVAKPALKHDTWNVVRVEHAMGKMEKAAGINSVASLTIKLPSGNEVLMSLRYDQSGAKRVKSNDQFVVTKQYNRISMKAILTQDPDMRGRPLTEATYADIANALKKYSDQPISDIEELYKRVLFHVGVNNTDNNLGNFEMYINEKQEWRLSPSYDVLPDPAQQNEFVVAVTDRHPKGTVITFDENFIAQLARDFEIEEERARQLAMPVLNTIVESNKYMLQAGVSDYDRQHLQSAFRVEESKQLLDKLSDIQIDIDEDLQFKDPGFSQQSKPPKLG